jgi:hypothetical protein
MRLPRKFHGLRYQDGHHFTQVHPAFSRAPARQQQMCLQPRLKLRAEIGKLTEERYNIQRRILLVT